MAVSIFDVYNGRPVILIAGVLVILSLVYRIYLRVREELQIKSLGDHAAKVSSWSPFGLSFLIKTVRAANSHKDYDWWLSNFSKHGTQSNPWTFETRVLGQRTIHTADEENIKAMLAAQFDDYGKGKQLYQDLHDMFGDSILAIDGQGWQDQRKLLRPLFFKERISNLNVFESHIQTLLPMLKNQTQPSQSVNVNNLFYRYTLDTATHFLLGMSVDSLQDEKSEFANAFAEVQRVQSMTFRFGQTRYITPKKSMRESLKVLEAFIQPIIEMMLRMSPEDLSKKTSRDEEYNFLYALAGFTRDRKLMRDLLITGLFAARDTTACTLAWTWYHLSTQPQTFLKLRQEVLNHVGKDKLPTYADLKGMKYLQRTINETLRLYPIVPYNVRYAVKDSTLPRGGGPDGTAPVGVPAGTPVYYSTLAMQRRADIYPPTSEKHPDPALFAPERWETWTPASWTYIPFNGGPRICVGQMFALTEVAYTTVRMLQSYERVECRMSEGPRQKAELVLQPADGVHLVFFRDGEKVV